MSPQSSMYSDKPSPPGSFKAQFPRMPSWWWGLQQRLELNDEVKKSNNSETEEWTCKQNWTHLKTVVFQNHFSSVGATCIQSQKNISDAIASIRLITYFKPCQHCSQSYYIRILCVESSKLMILCHSLLTNSTNVSDTFIQFRSRRHSPLSIGKWTS